MFPCSLKKNPSAVTHRKKYLCLCSAATSVPSGGCSVCRVSSHPRKKHTRVNVSVHTFTVQSCVCVPVCVSAALRETCELEEHSGARMR